MALWDSADLLRRCKNLARRPATDQSVTDAQWYDYLTEAQAEVYPEIFSRYPSLGYTAPVLLTTADSGKTYTFGTDAAGDPIRPVGHAEIYPSLATIPDSPLRPGDDFIWEGSLIRIPNNRTRAFVAGPYARFVVSPTNAISAASAPALLPKHARMLLVYKALEQWASRPGSGAKPDYYDSRFKEGLNKLFLEFATLYNGQAAAFGSSSSLLYIGDFGQPGLNT